MMRRAKEQGATAIIVVIFSVLLLLTVTVGFIRLVVQDQNRSTDSQLSRGAYDAALAGVEDGKRVLQACQRDGNASDACKAIAANKCTTVSDARIVSTVSGGSEVMLKRLSDGQSGGYDQAYTCVRIAPNTAAYTATVKSEASEVIPLRATEGFREITLAWFKSERPTAFRSNLDLPPLTAWKTASSETPPLLRVQLIQYDKSHLTMDAFGGAERTLYLLPRSAGANNTQFSLDGRKSNSPIQSVKCGGSIDGGEMCSTKITLPQAISVDQDASGMAAYLRISPRYGDTDIKVSLGGNAKFSWVQPTIDSTGRASNVFRRVSARTVFKPDIDIYPRATVDITKNLCKEFVITTDSYDQKCSYY